ncbi:MAG TPA: helix-turn-helix domain-containing protein [Anaerolineae bacterium]|nr:helix-turn-helix domain-containing protein [Anaerolineae bacterium]HPL29358.1 helix-turn-helix domain-containing protein [Anaerolineae bacterium]
MAEEAPPEVGRRIRELRERKGLSLRTLAEQSGLSVNAVSLIERGQSSPTVSTLHRLAAALGVRIVDLFGPEETARVVYVRAGERGQTQTPGALVESLGTGLAGQRIEPFVVTLDAGASGGEPITHGGQELVLGLAGRVDYTVDGRTYRIGEGDALLFEASLPHYWCNPTWEAARFLLVLEAMQGHGAPLLSHMEA